MLPNDDKPWAKPLARTVILLTIAGLACLSYYLESRDQFHLPEIVGVFLLLLTIVPPNLAVLYPWVCPPKHLPSQRPNEKQTVR